MDGWMREEMIEETLLKVKGRNRQERKGESEKGMVREMGFTDGLGPHTRSHTHGFWRKLQEEWRL